MLTISKIKALEPRTVRYMVADGSGLHLEIQPSGLKSWRFRYMLHKRPGKINLGRWPHLSLAEARQRRTELAQGIAEGKHPLEQRKAAERAKERGETLKEFSERYLRDRVARHPQNLKPMRRYFEREIWPKLGGKTLPQISKADLRDLIFQKRDAGHDQAALAIRNLLKRMYDYAVVCELVEANPLAAIPQKFVAEIVSRNRALDPREITAFLRALDVAPIPSNHKAALQLILLCLTRKGETRLAEWKEFSLERGEWEIPEEHSKTTAQIVYLSSQAVDILRDLKSRALPGQTRVFPARGAWHTPISADTLNTALARVPVRINHFTVHDLRRSAATNLSEQEQYSADVIEKALNHKIKGVRGVYNRAQYAKQRREMLQAWADCLDQWKVGE